MNNGISVTISTLDRIKAKQGIHGLRAFFDHLLKTEPEQATTLVNDENLHYCSLFLLYPQIEASGLYSGLIPPYRDALTVTDQLIHSNAESSILRPSAKTPLPYPALKWIFSTGCCDDGINSDYEQVMEHTAILLTRVYKDYSILPEMITMIFDRNRKRHLVHSLVWAFFECRRPDSLLMIANRLCSSVPQDMQLAQKLLAFVPVLGQYDQAEGLKQYTHFLQWFEENHLFLHYTGESFQQTCKPIPYIISLDAKYLCKPVAVDDGKPLNAVTDFEYNLMSKFNQRSEPVRIQLSSYSLRLYRRDFEQWKQWLLSPFPEQIRTAAEWTEGSTC